MKRPGFKELTTIERVQRHFDGSCIILGWAGRKEVRFLCRLSLVDPASIYRRKFSSREVLKEGIARGGNGETVP